MLPRTEAAFSQIGLMVNVAHDGSRCGPNRVNVAPMMQESVDGYLWLLLMFRLEMGLPANSF